MFRVNSQGNVCRRETATITGDPAGLPRPKVRDLLQVCRPILNVGVENRSEYGVLAEIRVERFDQLPNAFLPSQPFVKRWGRRR